MAYAALVFLDQELEKLLRKHDDYIHLCEKEQMESLHSNVIFLQKLLEDFPGNSSLMIKQLESRITDVAYEVRDIIGCGISEMRYQKTYKCCIEEVNSIIEDASEIRKILETKKNVLVRDSSATSSSTSAAPSSEGTTKVGLDTDVIQIKERIVGRNSALQIVPIVGMGGIGKTTLAKNVYEDPKTVEHFDVRFWVTVSQEYNTQKILKEILGDTEDTESLMVGVHKKLTGRRYLIVMDDIWNVEAWDSVRNAFPDGNNGSRIIVTTRLLEMATNVGSSGLLHRMQLMNEGQSWELFQKEASGQECFPSGQECFPFQLENVGKTISKNCKGLPLAIVVIARLLRLNRTQDYWEKFAKNMNAAMAEATDDDQLMKILSLSYDNLPPHLKACFLYTSMFPEDDEIPCKKLIRLWVAEGFLKPKRDKRMERVAEQCLVDLDKRNLISVSKKRSNGRNRTCSVHDVLRDLSLRKAKEDKFSQQIMTRNTGTTSNFTDKFFQQCMPWWFKEKTNFEHMRRIGVTPSVLRSLGNNTNYGHVYSFICHYDVSDYNLLPRLNRLRVLDVLEMPFTYLMEFDLVNLRYFAFTYDRIDTFTNIYKLKNLETLIIKMRAPFGLFFSILEMPNLKHFVVICEWNEDYLIDNYQLRISNSVLHNLQTLSGVTDLAFTTHAIEVFANLIKLKIQYRDHYYVDWERFCLKNLVHLRQLEELTFVLRSYYVGTSPRPLPPTNIAFPDELKKITLKGSIISWENMSAVGSLPNLEVLKLVRCEFESGEWEPIEGAFQKLKYLKLEVTNLEEWKVESSHFPCLEQLILSGCHALKEVPAEVGEIESLQKLVIHNYKAHIGDSARRLQEVQQSYGNYQLQVLIVNQPKQWWEEK